MTDKEMQDVKVRLITGLYSRGDISMVFAEIERLQSENTRLKAKLDKAVEDLRRCRRNKCDYCYYSNKNQNTPCRDCQSPISNCGDRWKWRGLVARK